MAPPFPQGSQEGFCVQIGRLEKPPGYEGPSGPVPEAAEEEGDCHKQQFFPQALPVAPQGDVDVFPEPAGEGDVPAPPELRQGGGKIGGLEVYHQIDPHGLGTAPGDVGIAAEVAVNLDGKGGGGQEERAAGVGGGVFIHRIHQEGCETIRNNQFFEKAPGHQLQAVSGAVIGEGPLLPQLGQQAGGLFDWPRHQLGEEGDEQGESSEIPLRRHFPPVDVNGVAECLEGIKGNTHRQDDIQDREGEGDGNGPAQVGQGLAEEIHVFEEEQQAQVHGQAHGQYGPGGPPGLPPLFNPQAAEVVHQGGEQQEDDELRLPAHVKIPTGCQQHELSEPEGQYVIEKENAGKENEEPEGIEQHEKTPSFGREYAWQS